jgi:hypothetical protein
VIVDVIVYTRENPNTLYVHNKFTNDIKPAFTDELGTKYWMVHISAGILQYTIDIPDNFNILARIHKYSFKHNITEHRGRIIRDDQWGVREDVESRIC